MLGKLSCYVVRLSTFLIAVALIAGMAGCDGVVQYGLTISSTIGGDVTTPGEGTFTYASGTVVNLVAESDDGYRFVNWTGDAGTIANVNAASTTITMHDSYSITANFEELDPGTLFAGGNGTEENPYQIANWHHLHNICDYLDNHFILINDLDTTTAGYAELAGPTANGGAGWQPIGTDDDPFTGTFDGKGYEIRDMLINRPQKDGVGLFRYVGEEGRIEDIGVVNVDVSGYRYVGGLVGGNGGNVANSYSGGSVTGEEYVGGLLGGNSGNVSYCYSTGSVTGESVVGGLVGWHALGTVSDAHATGSVSGEAGVGGLVGVNRYGTVTNSCATGSVTGDALVGGLVGYNDSGTVSNSYSTGSVTGYDSVGGLVGETHGGTYGANVSNCYSTGSVTGDVSVGGLVGHNWQTTVTDSFWDTETSGQATSDGGTGKTTAEMQDIATFSGAGWDIIAVANPGTRNPSYIWNIVNGVSYPFLSWQS